MSPRLQPQDIERYNELIRWEDEIRGWATEQFRNVAMHASMLMDAISSREGVDARQYEIDWTTGEMHRKDTRVN